MIRFALENELSEEVLCDSTAKGSRGKNGEVIRKALNPALLQGLYVEVRKKWSSDKEEFKHVRTDDPTLNGHATSVCFDARSARKLRQERAAATVSAGVDAGGDVQRVDSF
eukprot:Colp12_sorted_trinity150504_noHs@25303